MSDFKNIEKLGLTVWDNGTPHCFVVDAEELEALLQSAQVVYGSGFKFTDEFEWSSHQLSSDTVSGLIICIEPLKEKTKAEAALEFVEKFKSGKLSSVGYLEAEKEAKRILEMKDEA